MSLQKNLNEIRVKGITYLKNEFKPNESIKIVSKLDKISLKLKLKCLTVLLIQFLFQIYFCSFLLINSLASLTLIFFSL